MTTDEGAAAREIAFDILDRYWGYRPDVESAITEALLEAEKRGYERAKLEPSEKLVEAIGVICSMQNKLKPFMHHETWTSGELLLAYNLGAHFLGCNPKSFNDYLKRTGQG